MPETYDRMSELDLRQFDAFLKQEGYTKQGQVARLNMIEPMIMSRVEKAKKERRRELVAQRKGEAEIDAAIRAEFQPLRFEYIYDNGVPAAVIVEKSSLPPGEKADYTVFVPAHIDSIVPRWPSYNPAEQGAQPNEETGMIESVGAWDEGAAVMNAVSVAADVRIAPGLRLYAAFTRGEESPQSTGAKAIIAQWKPMEQVDLIVGNEIGPFPESAMPAKGDMAMRYVVARPGRYRMFAKFKVIDDARGHASLPTLPNAQKERDRFQVFLEDVFSGDDHHGFRYPEGKAALKNRHDLLGEERIDTGKVWYPVKKGAVMFDGDVDDFGDNQGADTDYVHPDEVHAKFYIRLVPPSTLETKLQEIQQVHAHIGFIRDWAGSGIASVVEPFRGEMSYPPFAMPPPERNAAVRVTHEMLRTVSGVEPIATRGESVADENLYAEELRGNLFHRIPTEDPAADPFVDSDCAVISIPPWGNHAHSPYESLDADDMMRTRHVLARLLRDPDGYASIARERAKKRAVR